MSRNLLIVRVGKKIKIAQFCIENGGPTGQGQIIQDFMNTEMDLRVLKAKVKRLAWASDEEVETCWEDVGATEELVTVGQSREFKRVYPEFHRDTGAELLSLVQAGKIFRVASSLDFRKDELFCEYVYDLNLDTKKIRLYFFGKRYQTLTFDQFKQENLAKLESQMRGKKEKEKEKENRGVVEELMVDSNQDTFNSSLSFPKEGGNQKAKSVPSVSNFPIIVIPVKRKLML